MESHYQRQSYGFGTRIRTCKMPIRLVSTEHCGEIVLIEVYDKFVGRLNDVELLLANC